jgi:hypothetical protein
MAAGREPVAQRLLGAVDERLPLSRSVVARTLRYRDSPIVSGILSPIEN